MNQNDIRIDIRDEEDNIHEVYITTEGELVIWTMNKAGRVSNKSYGKIHPMELQNRASEMLKLARELMKAETD